MIKRYARQEFLSLFSEEKKYEYWLEVELACCFFMEKLPQSMIPSGTTLALQEKIKQHGALDAARIEQIELETRHDLIAFLTYLEEILGEKARFLHLGLTSSDVVDTAFALQLTKAVTLIEKGIEEKLLSALKQRALEHKHTPLMGRSHGIHAEPITLGLVFASFYAEVERNLIRLRHAKSSVAVGKISGAVGVYGSGLLSPALEKEILLSLGLTPETVSTQIVARDRHAELFLTLSLLAAAIERIALTIRHWQRTEVSEAEEAFSPKQKGSSAMPHKKNPILSENLCGLARLVRSQASASVENIALWHERDISHSSVERIIGPDITALVDFMVHRCGQLVATLKVNVDKMAENLSLKQGLYCSEKVMLALVEKGLFRMDAYEKVQKVALEHHTKPMGTFMQAIQNSPEISALLTKEDIALCFDLSHHLRHVDEIFDNIFGAK